MHGAARRRRWHVRTAGAGLAVAALVAGALTAPASAQPPVAPAATADPCPSPVPAAEVLPGLRGEGLTVVRGTTPQAFAVEVLGVLPNGITAGKDLIVVEVSDVAGGHVIDQGGGGIWAGMSGSPVYVEGRLLGSVAYGFTGSNSPIGGVTPATDMEKLLDLTARAKARPAAVSEAETVKLPAPLRRQVAARAEAGVPRGGLQRLPIPLSLSGLGPSRVQRFQADADAAGLSVLARAGAGRAAPSAEGPFAVPQPGGNFTSVLSYGDLTVAGTGTTTAVCGDQALAWGHPFNFAGAVGYGANEGVSLAIIRDDVFGSFKLATVGDAFGTVDQDRLSGVRARLGVLPRMAEVTTTIGNSITGARRTGTTQVAAPDLLPAVALFAALGNYDHVFDEIGDGRASSRWTITGTRAGGQTFTVSRTNQWASTGDIAFEPALDLALTIDALVNQEDEPVTVQKVDLQSNITSDFQQFKVTKLEVAVGKGAYRAAKAVTVRAGDTIKVRSTLKYYRSTKVKRVVSTLKVPARAQGQEGFLQVSGGLSSTGPEEEEEDGCLIDPSACEDDQPSSLDGLIKEITSAPRNNDLLVGFYLGSEQTGDSGPVRELRARQRYTVVGSRGVEVLVRR